MLKPVQVGFELLEGFHFGDAVSLLKLLEYLEHVRIQVQHATGSGAAGPTVLIRRCRCAATCMLQCNRLEVVLRLQVELAELPKDVDARVEHAARQRIRVILLTALDFDLNFFKVFLLFSHILYYQSSLNNYNTVFDTRCLIT